MNKKLVTSEEENVLTTKKAEASDKVTLVNEKILIKSGRTAYELSLDELKSYLNSDLIIIAAQLNFLQSCLANTFVYTYDESYKYKSRKNIVYDIVKNKVIIPDNSTTVVPPLTKPDYDIIYNPTLSCWSYQGVSEVEEKEKTIEELKDERNDLIAATDWLVLRHTREKALGKQTTLGHIQYIQLEQYRDELCRMFENKPYDFPNKPDFI